MAKIKLAVIYYGSKDQFLINEIQFKDLKNELKDFDLIRYDFNKGEHNKLITDYKKNKIDIVLKNSYGRGNEAHIESLLELNKIPYLGSNSQTTIVGTSKFISKNIFRSYGLPIANDVYVDKEIWKKSKQKIINEIRGKIKYPCMAKDICGTDSRGIYYINKEKELINLLSKNLAKYSGLIIEEFISNAKETTCMVVGNDNPRAYEPVEIVKDNDFLTGEDKDRGLINFNLPPKMSKKLINEIKKASVSAHIALGCKTFSRVDILVKGQKLYILEVDVHPGFKLSSPTLKSAQYAKESPNDLFLKFINFSKQIKLWKK